MRPSRRQFFQAAGAAGLTLGARSAAPAFAAGDDEGPVLRVGNDIALARTQHGPVRGYVLRGIHHFLGIPYGADTSGANRFMPPQKPKPWTDPFPALWWGNSAPQDMERRYANPHMSFRDHWNYDDVSEDCLRMNVFTPAVGDGRKRPVLVWLHGGGFTAGNGIEHDGYNGENFARMGDVVYCSLNHRLGPFGFCDLSGVGGERFAASGNVGMLDIVAALEWVRDNVEAFGGDPGNVTIMGQSGGGAKVCTLSAMPAAKGLFRKAVVLSGASLRMGERSYAQALGARLLEDAGLTAADIGKLQEMPWKDFLAIATKAGRQMAEEAGGGGLRRGFNPVVDGTVLPQDPYHPGPAPTAADVPMLICSTFHEQSPSLVDARLEAVTLDEVVEKVKARAGFRPGYGDKAREVVDAYARAFPGKKPVEIWALASSTRQSVVALADQKSKQPAPVYVAWFGWPPPLFDGRARAFHCVDICFWLANTDLMLSHTGGGRAAAPARDEDGPLAPQLHEGGRPERRRPPRVAPLHGGQGRGHGPRRRVRGPERPRPRGPQGPSSPVGHWRPPMSSDLSRRDFLTAGLALPAAGLRTTGDRSLPPEGSQPKTDRVKLTYRTLGKTGLEVTALSFGCMTTPEPSVIRRAADLGINLFDTARVYQNGNNERMVGAALRDVRPKVIITSKSTARTGAEALADLDTSLRELGTDYLDVWYLHNKSDPEQVTEDLLDAQRVARESGKIRFAGVSTHFNMDRMLAHVAKLGHVDVVLTTYNFAMRSVGADQNANPDAPKSDMTGAIRAARKAGLGIVAMKVMAGGVSRVRRGDRVYGADPQALGRRLGQPGVPVAAIKWALDNESVDTAEVCMTDHEELDENLRAMAEPYGEKDEKLLTARLDSIGPSYCRMCGACGGACEKGVPVPDVLRFLTYAEGYGQFALARERFLGIPRPARDVRCRDCAACSFRCAHGVAVRDRLTHAQELLA
jgi:para-nitrobenzyl esterase